MRKLIAYCGLDCEKCDARLATLKDNHELREKTAKLWSELNGVAITADMINCMAAVQTTLKRRFAVVLCPIRKCALDKGVETCGDCENIKQCQIVGKIIENNSEALENLKI